MSSEYDLFICNKCNEKFEMEDTITNCLNCYSPGNQWIKCSEQLPEKDGRYLVYFDNIEQFYAIGFSSYNVMTKEFNHTNITHWMSPPEKPNE